MSTVISAAQALEEIKRGDALLIDVREPEEFKTEHIAYAMSIPLSTLESGFAALDIPVSKALLFHCFKGSRGLMACEQVQRSGSCQNTISNIEGGIEAWKSAGFPVIGTTPRSTSISMFRQVQITVGLLIAICIAIGFSAVPAGFIVAGILATALFFSGLTGWCGMALLLAKMPWNR